MNPENLIRAYAILGDLTPMMTDCGMLCGAACCQADEDGQGGVHLFPGERARLEDCNWGWIRPGGLDPAFVRAARDALRAVAEDPEGDAFLERWHALEEEYRKPLW